MTLYEQLAAIAEVKRPHGYLAHYATDLTVHDALQLAHAEAGAHFLWLLRPHGTELFAVGTGRDPVWATYWLDRDKGNCRSAPTLCYFAIASTAGGATGTVKSLSEADARRLAAKRNGE